MRFNEVFWSKTYVRYFIEVVYSKNPLFSVFQEVADFFIFNWQQIICFSPQ